MIASDNTTQDELLTLRRQLAKVRLTHRDSSLKFTRERNILKRLLSSFTTVYQSNNKDLNLQLSELRKSLENNSLEKNGELGSAISQMAVIERGLKKQALTMEKQTINLDNQIRHSGEALLRIPGLPIKVKRDVRDLLSLSDSTRLPQGDQAYRLLGLFERSVKIISTNPDLACSEIEQAAEKELILRLCEELQSLITELDFDGDAGDQLLDIRAKLLIGVEANHLIEITLDVLRLVIEGTKHERKSSEKLLEQINTSLKTNLKSTADSVEQSQSYSIHRQEMNLELSQLVTKSQSVLNQGTDLTQIKQTIDPMFNELQSLAERLMHAETREQALIERMIYTQNQMEALQETTLDYRRRLNDQAERMLQDPLTKVYNRTAFHERLEVEYHRWIKSQHDLRIILFDIDNFREVNEKFGFTAGDKALKIIARTLSKEMSGNDTIARFSGEEFIVIMPEHGHDETYRQIERVQSTIAKLPFKFKQQSLSITLSASSVGFKENDTPEDVLERVFRAMSETKKQGHNTINWK
ncbi:diguanylate cyclase [Vibrio sp. WJH972]